MQSREALMESRIGELVAQMGRLELELESEFARRRAELKFHLEKGRAVFKEEILRRHKEIKTALWAYLKSARPMVIVTAPVIYSLIIPLVLVDIFVSIYQLICFPVYRITKVERGDYIVFDRQHLGYLNAIEKINCAYCSYANGLIAYVAEIASRTEQHWCPIKHARRTAGIHLRYKEFADYGDGEGYQDRVEAIVRAREARPNGSNNGPG